MRDVIFWEFGNMFCSGITSLLKHLNFQNVKKYNFQEIDKSKINIITFAWEIDSEKFMLDNEEQNQFYTQLKKFNDLGFYILSDYSTEGIIHQDTTRVLFLKKLYEIGVDFSKFGIVLNNSSKDDGGYINYNGYNLRYFYFPHFFIKTPIHMDSYVGDLSDYTNIKKEKDFLCLNRRVRKPKYDFLERLWERDLLKNTHYTWVSNYVSKQEIKSTKFIDSIGVDLDNFNSIQLDGDVLYGKELDFKDEYLYTINPKWYYSAKVNLVVETLFNNEPVHITEKTFKPIYLGIPFVVYGSKNHLSSLKKLGFKTFENVIDESYDKTMNIDLIIDSSLDLLNKIDTNEIFEICEYNKSLIRDESHKKHILNTFFIGSLKQFTKKNVI